MRWTDRAQSSKKGFRATMITLASPWRLRACAFVAFWCFLASGHLFATGVTIITHGFEADSTYPTWITAMADAVPQHTGFPGTNFTTYRLTMSYNGTDYLISSVRVNGAPPSATDSGEIIVELDWSQ